MSRYGYRHRYDRYSLFPQSKSKSERMADAARKQQALAKKGQSLAPVVLQGFAIASTFWGKAWCKNIESYHDYANRLPRGRAYVRSNSVIDLQIERGVIRAQVMGSSLYRVAIDIRPAATSRWQAICKACTGRIGSMIELLQGRLSTDVMSVMTSQETGLFPQPAEIGFTCSCPDIAGMCKHVAAVMYGIGNRLDTQPELLFILRGVDSADLIATIGAAPAAGTLPVAGALVAEELSDVFGVEIDTAAPAAPPSAPAQARPARQPTTPAVVPKRPRGRPRKNPVDAAPAMAPAVVPKRPRGRPRKNPVEAAPAAASAGRPSRTTAAKAAPRAPKAGTRPTKRRPA